VNWKQRIYGLLSVFFYGYGAGFASVMTFGASTDPAQLTIFNLIIFPSIAGLIAVFPKLGKTFAELQNEGNSNS